MLVGYYTKLTAKRRHFSFSTNKFRYHLEHNKTKTSASG